MQKGLAGRTGPGSATLTRGVLHRSHAEPEGSRGPPDSLTESARVAARSQRGVTSGASGILLMEEPPPSSERRLWRASRVPRGPRGVPSCSQRSCHPWRRGPPALMTPSTCSECSCTPGHSGPSARLSRPCPAPKPVLLRCVLKSRAQGLLCFVALGPWRQTQGVWVLSPAGRRFGASWGCRVWWARQGQKKAKGSG